MAEGYSSRQARYDSVLGGCSMLTISSDFTYTLSNNTALNETSARFQMPAILRQTILSDGFGMTLYIHQFYILNLSQNSTPWKFGLPVWTTLEEPSIPYYSGCMADLDRKWFRHDGKGIGTITSLAR